MNRAYRSLIFGILPFGFGLLARADNPPPKVDRSRASMPTSADFAKVIGLTDEIAKPESRALALSRIAYAQAIGGDREAAQRTFALAVGLVDRLSTNESNYSPHILAWVGQAQQAAGDHDGAIASYRKAVSLVAANPPNNNGPNISQYINIITYQMKVGDVAGAHASFEKGRQAIKDAKGPLVEGFGERWIIGLQALVGDFDDAFRAIEANEAKPNPQPFSHFKRAAFEEIAQAIGSADPMNGREVLERLRREAPTIQGIAAWELAYLNYAIATAAAEIGASDLALDIVDSEKEDPALDNASRGMLLFKRGRVLTEVARAQGKAGHLAQAKTTLDRAVKVAATIEDDSARKGVLSFAEEARIEMGDVTEALRSLQGENPLSLSSVDQQRRVAAIQEKAGDFNAARKTRMKALGDAEADLRNLKSAPPILDENPLRPSFNERTDEAAAKVVTLKAELGDTDAALTLAQTIQSQSARHSALTIVVGAQGRFGDVNAAVTWIRRLKNAEERSRYVDALTLGLGAWNAPPEPTGKLNR